MFFLFYIYVGYPLIIKHWAKLHPKPYSKNMQFVPQISIIIIVYNEEKNIVSKIDNIFSSGYPAEKIQLIVVSDGSTDSTNSYLKSLGRDIDFIENDIRKGKSGCINEAVSLVKHNIIVFMDARQRLENGALLSLVSNFNDIDVGAVSGELVFVDPDNTNTAKNLNAYWSYEKNIRKNESKLHSVQGVTGALYAIRTDLMPYVPSGVVLDDVYIPMHVIKAGKRVLFESDAVIYDVPTTNYKIEKKRKIRTIAGNYQLLVLCPFLLNPLKYKTFFQYMSHKVLRLMSPLFLVALYVSSLYLYFNGDYFFYDFSFYALYLSLLLTATNIKGDFKILKLLRYYSSFIQLNYFALHGFIEFLTNKKIHLWK